VAWRTFFVVLFLFAIEGFNLP